MRRPLRLGFVSIVVVGMWLTLGGAQAFAATESHPYLQISFGHNATEAFSDPNGIAIDESNGEVYVADIGTNTVYKFNASGAPVDFSAVGLGTTNELTGTPTESFSFPNVPGTPAALAVDNSKSPSDPSAGDLYVMDAGHGVINKFSPDGEYLGPITGFTPATGSAAHELLGLAVDAEGTVRVELHAIQGPEENHEVVVDEFDDSLANKLIAEQANPVTSASLSGVPAQLPADGFAVGPTGDDYLLYGSPCACTAKLGQQLAGLGELDATGSGDVALAADPATNHVYADKQSEVVEWDNGALNGNDTGESAGTLVSSFGWEQLSGSSGQQGGIGVDGASGDVYVSDPTDGEVYAFASDAPAVSATAATGTTKESATLHGAVNPRGATIARCEFEYAVADEFGRVRSVNGVELYEGKVPCEPGDIGEGTTPVPVSAGVSALQPSLLYRFRIKAVDAAGVVGESAGLFATLGEGFGVKKLEVSFLEQDGSPDTQAGSHPYELVNSIEFNSSFVRKESNADSPYVREPDGTLKDLKVDLPPGFVGDPNATAKKCTLSELDEFKHNGSLGCTKESHLGYLTLAWGSHVSAGALEFEQPVSNMVPPEGTALQLGINYIAPNLFINNGLLAGGDYPIQATIVGAPTAAPVLRSHLTLYGMAGQEAVQEAEAAVREGKAGAEGELKEAIEHLTPFLTLPTGCHGPLRSTISVDSYQEPGHWVGYKEPGQEEEGALTQNSAGTPVSLTGCSKLLFPPEISAVPDTTDASTSSGLTVHVKVPQTAAFNPSGLAESSVRNTIVTLPEGVAINPSGGDGLEACTSDENALGGALGSPGDQIGFKGWRELNSYEHGVQTPTFTPEKANPLQPGMNFCPDSSKIATVKIKAPLLEHELEGAVYLAAQNANPFGSLMAFYLVAEDPYSGSFIKLPGEVKLSPTGQIVASISQPDLPFEDAELHFFGGERAPLTTPSHCGMYTTTAVFTPWDGNGPVTSTSPFTIDHGPGGGPCPGAKLPFNPAFSGGSTNLQAGAFTPLTGTFSREDGEQQMARLHFTLPPGLSGVLTGVALCDEADANAGTCSPGSLIGETTVAAGVGSDPITVKGGKVYLTGPYKGAPFGLSAVVPAKAGPFDLEHDTTKPATNMPACDCIVVRAKLEINPLTTAVTITSNAESEGFAIPHLIDGIPVELKKINFTTTRNGFQFNPTNCEKMLISGSEESDEGESRPVEVPFQVTNCARLSFKPAFKVSTSGRTSRSQGASLHVTLTYPKAPWGTQTNIRSVKVNLPRQLPSRLTTLQKACAIRIFNTNPATCPAASRVGFAKAITPILPIPLQGPAYFVSHGGAKFPELIIVLQGYGVTIDLHGETFINEKTNITSSTYHTLPDQPVTSFELTLPQGPNSALAANGNLCKATKTVFIKRKVHGLVRKVRKTVATKLVMPTAFTAQNGAIIHQHTPIAITGCSKQHTKRTTSSRAGSKKP